MTVTAHTMTPAAWVIRCTGLRGAYGPARPVGRWLAAYDPDAVDPTLTFRGVATWTADRDQALRFPDEATARACYTNGLTDLYQVGFDPVPADQPPVVTGEFSRKVTRQSPSEEQIREAQDVVDRLWMDGYFSPRR